jgi:hypothetical protein
VSKNYPVFRISNLKIKSKVLKQFPSARQTDRKLIDILNRNGFTRYPLGQCGGDEIV